MQGTTVRLSLLLALAVPTMARAEGMGEDAREAYDRGTAAHARHDYRAAASEFARADLLAPNPVALKAALDEALLADDPELAMQLVERGRVRGGVDAGLATSIADANRRFTGRTGRVRVDCGGRSCAATIDARPISPADVTIVLVGPHRLTLQADGGTLSRDIAVQGDRETDVVLPAPPVSSTPAASSPLPVVSAPRTEARSEGISPAWFATAAAMTAVVGGAAVASGVDTADQHSSFVSRGCGDPGPSGYCSALASNGASAQLRTDLLAAVAGALGVGTLTLAFFVRWHAPREASSRASLVVGDRGAAVRIAF